MKKCVRCSTYMYRFITQMIKVPTHKNQQTHFINQENDHVVEIVPPLLATRKINIVLFSVIMQPLLTPMEFLSPVFRHFKRAMKEMLRANTEKVQGLMCVNLYMNL